YDAAELEGVAQQKCLAHLIRNSAKLSDEKAGQARRFPRQLKDVLQRALLLFASRQEMGPKALTGFIPLPAPPNFAVTVALASDLGRITSTGPAFRFPALAPGHYELYAEARENSPGTRAVGGYAELLIERNISNYVLPMTEVGGDLALVNLKPSHIEMLVQARLAAVFE